ncbi:MAG: ABC transporter ATP-binding protein [Wenyingzhuangia sp.]|uniref:peptidase domain-containing ABC transporter n=1 Tax=Wenyingzhuangia sp. TaxID=1964193 RepID=UPI003219D5F6
MILSPLVRFWKLINPYKKSIRLIYYYAIISGVVNLSLPLGIQAIINYLQTGELTTSWIVLVVFVLIGIATNGKIQINQLRIVEDIQQSIFAKSAFEFAYRVPKIKQNNLDKVHAPELINRFFDVLTIQKGLPKILIDFSLSAFQIIFGLTLLTIYSSYFIILGISLFLILFLIFKITGPKGLKTSITESKYKYKLAGWLEEIAGNTKTFKILNKGNLHLDKTDDINLKYLKNREAHFKILIKQFMLFIGFKVWVAAALLVLGGYLVFNQQMNIGQFVASEIIIILIINSVEKITRIVETIYDVLTALDKIGFVTDLELDESSGNGKMISNDDGVSIDLVDVSFKYEEQDNYVFNNLSVSIKPKAKVWLKGNTGKGKSTLLNILARIQNIEEGNIFINGRPSDYYNLDSYQEEIGFISPYSGIFEGTIEENILVNREVATEDLDEVLEHLHLKSYLSNLSNGLKTQVFAKGRKMPKSIVQKIVLARYLVSKPSILLMEDPLQFIDDDEKKSIIDYVMDEKKSWTVIVVADNLYWADKANQIIKL